jgi:hypothetical protein
VEWRSLILTAVTEETRPPPTMRHPPDDPAPTQRTVTEAPASTAQALYFVTIDREGPRVTTLAPGVTVTVGRARECDIALGQLSMSRRHFAVMAGTPLLLTEYGFERPRK